MKMLGENIAVLIEKQEERKVGEIIASVAVQPISFGTIAFAPETMSAVSPGDRVVFPTGAGTPIDWKGTQYAIMTLHQLKAIVNE